MSLILSYTDGFLETLVIRVGNATNRTFVQSTLCLAAEVVIHSGQHEDDFVTAIHRFVGQSNKVACFTRLNVTNDQSCSIPVARHVWVCQLIQHFFGCLVNLLNCWRWKSKMFLVIIPQAEVATTISSELRQPICSFIIVLHDRRNWLIDFPVNYDNVHNVLLGDCAVWVLNPFSRKHAFCNLLNFLVCGIVAEQGICYKFYLFFNHCSTGLR